jgi:pyrrolysine biosynthesis protein PylC
MDLEVMVDGAVPRVIEIDARLPSQTPTAVYHSTGLNLVAELVGVFTGGAASGAPADPPRGVCYQHVRAADGGLAVLGEHVMSGAGPLHLLRDEAGADEVLTDRVPGAPSWSATLICHGADAGDARARAEKATARLAREAALEWASSASGATR